MYKYNAILIIVLLMLYTFPLKGQEINDTPLYKELKIEKIKKPFPDLYYIYATCNDSLYKILSYYDKHNKKGIKIKKGKTYYLRINEVVLYPTSSGVDLHNLSIPSGFPRDSSICIPRDSINYYPISDFTITPSYMNHTIIEEKNKLIIGTFESSQLNGIRIVR